MILRLHIGDVHAPTFRGGRLQHHPSRGAHLAHRHEEVPGRTGAVGVLVAVLDLVAVAWATFTLAQSASISSATISGIPVRTPCPISERWQTMVTVPSGAIETKARGLFTVPCGMPSAPHLGASSASAGRDGKTCTASTRPVVERMPFRTPRRLTFSMPDVEHDFANVLGHVTLPQLA